MSTEESQKFFEKSPLGFVLLELAKTDTTDSLNASLTYCNPAFERLASININSCIGKNLKEIFADSDAFHREFLQLFGQLKNTQDSIEFDFYLSSSNRWLLVNAYLSHERTLTVVFTDITNFKHSKEELERAKELADENAANTTAIIEGTADSVWAFDRNYLILYINNVFQRDFQQAFGVLLEKGSNLLTALPEPIRPFWKVRYDRVLSNEQFSIVDEVDSAIGTLYIQVIFNPIIQNGEVVGGSCFGSNITEKVNSEKQLRRLSQAVEQSPASVVMTDLEGRIVYVNGKFTQVTGYTLEEAKGKNPNILKSGELSDETYSQLWDTISAGGEWRGELHNRRKNGELF